MQFSVVIIAILAAAPGAFANLHTFAWCVDNTAAQDFQTGPSSANNDAATRAACAQYLVRNTGPNQWDTCPDCVVGTNGVENVVCRSAAAHIGGDQWTDYCSSNGASFGDAN